VSKEFKYGIEGLLMAITFFIAMKILFFFAGTSSQQQSEAAVATTDNNIPSISSTNSLKAKHYFPKTALLVMH
jgi:hypothetical protein